MEMLEIDGSRGEGGGQMVRTTVAMSTVTGIPVHLTRIRENRPTNGLSRQHVAAVNAVARMTGCGPQPHPEADRGHLRGDQRHVGPAH